MSILSLTPRADAAQTALPGTINYIEGQVLINGNLLNSRQEGNVSLQRDDMLSTTQGKVEVLLSPGAFLRVGNNSQIRMVSPGMGDPTIEVVRGEVMVEVDYLPKLARLDILERGADAALLKEGVYRFNADEGSISVFDGKAQVGENGKTKDFGRGKELLLLSDARLKAVSFNTKAPDDLGPGLGLESLLRHMVLAAGRWILLEPVRISVLLAGICGVCALLWVRAGILWRPRVHSRTRRDRRGAGFPRRGFRRRICAGRWRPAVVSSHFRRCSGRSDRCVPHICKCV
jgi:hypothetical protein